MLRSFFFSSRRYLTRVSKLATKNNYIETKNGRGPSGSSPLLNSYKVVRSKDMNENVTHGMDLDIRVTSMVSKKV